MKNIFNLITEFVTGFTGLIFSVATLALVWNIFTGTTVLGIDVISSVMSVITQLGSAGFVGLVTLVLVLSLVPQK